MIRNVGSMGSRVRRATESRRHSPGSQHGLRLYVGKPQAQSEAMFPLKIVKTAYHPTVIVTLGLVLPACGGKPVGLPPASANTVAVKAPLLNPSLDERIDTLVRLLSNRAIEHEGGVMWTGCVLKSEGAKQLVWVGRAATRPLMRAMRDPGRDRAAHVVLTAIWEPERLLSGFQRPSRFIWFRPSVGIEDLRDALALEAKGRGLTRHGK